VKSRFNLLGFSMRTTFNLCLAFLLVILTMELPAQTGKLTNPDISIIGDFGGSYMSGPGRNFHLFFNEAEMSFRSSVDPYARADFYFAYGRTPGGEYEAELEEAYITTLSLPLDLKLKAGRFRLALGRLNLVHPHALPFIDMPLASETFFGDEGFADEGLSVSWLVPNQLGFYQEIIIEVGNTPAETPLFSRPESDRYLFLAHLKNFWELSDNSTLELGLSAASGPNHELMTTRLGAFDLTYKWKPLQFNRYRSFVWQSEVFLSRYTMEGDARRDAWGIYSFLTYQVGQRWFVTGRFDYSDHPLFPGVNGRGYGATVGWYATEYQKIEIGGRGISGNLDEDRTEILLRWVFVIGAHGAHQY
jgi:hypothetical protein